MTEIVAEPLSQVRSERVRAPLRGLRVAAKR